MELLRVMTNEILIFLIAFAAGIFLLVFAGIVWISGKWVEMADRIRRDRALGIRQSGNFRLKYRRQSVAARISAAFRAWRAVYNQGCLGAPPVDERPVRRIKSETSCFS